MHNAATLREAAEILVAKVERSCTEEQVKNIKSHFLKFSLESKQLTPEMHVVVSHLIVLFHSQKVVWWIYLAIIVVILNRNCQPYVLCCLLHCDVIYMKYFHFLKATLSQIIREDPYQSMQ